MNSKKNQCDRDEGCRSTRRDFNTRLTALLIIACTPLRLVRAQTRIAAAGSSTNEIASRVC